MNNAIESFLNKNTVASIAVMINNAPYSFNCFYAFDNTTKSLWFKSSEASTHVLAIEKNEHISGTIYRCSHHAFQTEGVQFLGKAKKHDGSFTHNYYSKYPFARAMPGTLYRVEFVSMKYSVNKAGIKKKLFFP